MSKDLSHSDSHLDSDQLLKAVVAKSDLPRPVRIHLKQCPQCSQEVKRLGSRFGSIGRMARDLSPDALGRVRLPDSQRRFFLGRRVGLRPALGMAMAMVLLMMIILYRPMGRLPVEMPTVDVAELNPQVEAQLTAEIQALLHNPLPEEYQQLTSDFEFGDWGDPTDFIVPDVDGEVEEELGRIASEKGVA